MRLGQLGGTRTDELWRRETAVLRLISTVEAYTDAASKFFFTKKSLTSPKLPFTWPGRLKFSSTARRSTRSTSKHVMAGGRSEPPGGPGAMAMSQALVLDDHGVTENKAVGPGRLTDGLSIGLLATVFPDERCHCDRRGWGQGAAEQGAARAVDGVLRARVVAGFRQYVRVLTGLLSGRRWARGGWVGTRCRPTGRSPCPWAPRG